MSLAPALDRVGDFTAFVGEAFDEATTYAAFRKAESVGRPIGSPTWLEGMEGEERVDAETEKARAENENGATIGDCDGDVIGACRQVNRMIYSTVAAPDRESAGEMYGL